MEHEACKVGKRDSRSDCGSDSEEDRQLTDEICSYRGNYMRVLACSALAERGDFTSDDSLMA